MKEIIISILEVLSVLALMGAIIVNIVLAIQYDIKHKKKVVSCNRCKHLYFNNDGSTDCKKNISNDVLASFNEANIRPCKELEDSDGKEKETTT